MPDDSAADPPSAELLIALGRDREAVEAAARESLPAEPVGRIERVPEADDGAAPVPHDREEPS